MTFAKLVQNMTLTIFEQGIFQFPSPSLFLANVTDGPISEEIWRRYQKWAIDRKKNREKFGETFYTRLRLTSEQNTKLHGGAKSLRKDIPLTLVLILPSNS